ECSGRNKVRAEAIGLPYRLPAVQSRCASLAQCKESNSRGRNSASHRPCREAQRPELEMYLSNAGTWHLCVMQVLLVRPGNFALGSAHSRAAARSLLAAREGSELEKSPGLAETIRAARMRARGEESPTPPTAGESGRGNGSGNRGGVCLVVSSSRDR